MPCVEARDMAILRRSGERSRLDTETLDDKQQPHIPFAPLGRDQRLPLTAHAVIELR